MASPVGLIDEAQGRRLAQAVEAFAGNRIVERGGHWWRCRQPREGAFAFDVYCDALGGVSVIGAAAGVRFDCPEGCPVAKVHRLGEHALDDELLGMAAAGSPCPIWTFCRARAQAQLRALAADERWAAVTRDLRRQAPRLTVADLRATLIACGCPVGHCLGQVPSFRVMCGVAAIMKLSQLLRAEAAAAAAPPAS